MRIRTTRRSGTIRRRPLSSSPRPAGKIATPRDTWRKNGVPLTIEVLYYDRGFEKYYTIYQEDLRKVGINLNLRFVTPETAFKLLDDQQFDMFGVGYGGGGPFPEPSQFFDSAQADQRASSTVP